MQDSFNLISIIITNLLGFMLLTILTISSRRKLREKTRENRYLLQMLVSAGLACLLDPLSFLCDGVPGLWGRIAIYVLNSLLYISNMVTAVSWVVFLGLHLDGSFDKRRLRILTGILYAGILLLVVNVFCPLVFSVNESNVYARGPLFWLYLAVDFGYLFDSAIWYYRSKAVGGILKFFPIWVFYPPLIIGAAVQSVVYGTSLIACCSAISIACVFASLQNETIYRDHLTGVYSRPYLDYLLSSLARHPDTLVTGFMLDVNGFKRINDEFGHAEGDVALRIAAGILAEAVGNMGSVIRYAGDEFVILINTQDDIKIERVQDRMYDKFAAFNQSGVKPYKLSVSVGKGKADFTTQTADGFLEMIDTDMYNGKRAFYDAHPEANRRASDRA